MTNRTRNTGLTQVLGGFLLLFIAVATATAQNDAITVEGASGSVGQPAELNVYIRDVMGNTIDYTGAAEDGVYELNIIINFDPTLVDAIAVESGPPLIANPPTFMITQTTVSSGKVGAYAAYLAPLTALPLTLGSPAPGDLVMKLLVTPSAQAAGQTINFTYTNDDMLLIGFDGAPVLQQSMGNLDVNVGSISVSGGAPPEIVSFSVDPTSVIQGSAAQLSWEVNNATSVSIDQGIGSVASQSSTSVTPSATTTYTLTASNSNGSDSAMTTLTVSSLPVPVITSFAADPAQIEEGESTTLSWDVDGADSVEILPTLGSVGANGMQIVSPTETTTYTLTATNAGGSVSQMVTINVSAVPVPVIDLFSASEAAILAGDRSTLSWQVSGATTIDIQPDVGNVLASASTIVEPTQTTTYTLSASNAGGTVSETVTVTVYPQVEIVAFSVSPNQILEGQSAELTWNVLHSDSVVLTPGDLTLQPSGSMTVQPTQTTDYFITVTGPLDQERLGLATLVVTGDPSLNLSKSTVALGGNLNSDTVTLGVNTAGSFEWSISALPTWLTATPQEGTISMASPVEIQLSVDRKALFPGRAVSADLVFSADGLLSTQMSLTAERAESADEAYIYFPLVEADALSQATIAIVNTSETSVDCLLQIFAADGTLAVPVVETELAPLASFRESVQDLPDGAAWAVASLTGSTSKRAGISGTGSVTVRTLDGEELYGLGPSKGRADQLRVPHIAKDTVNFFTRGAVVNLDDAARTSSVAVKSQAGADQGNFEIGAQVSGGQTVYDYETLLGPSIAEAGWGSIGFDIPEAKGGLAAEVFGFKPAESEGTKNRRTVGVGIDGEAVNELYFAHIAANLENFWTAIVVINASANEAQVDVAPYRVPSADDAGELIDGGFTLSLNPGEKRTFVVILGVEPAFGEGASWVKFTATEPLIGYELFANPDSSPGEQFAGLEAITSLGRNLVFPHTENAVSEGFTAVAVVNPGDETANITLSLISASGVRKEAVETNIQPKSKRTFLAALLFAESTIDLGDTILVESDRDIAGFELYGTQDKTIGAVLSTAY